MQSWSVFYSSQSIQGTERVKCYTPPAENYKINMVTISSGFRLLLYRKNGLNTLTSQFFPLEYKPQQATHKQHRPQPNCDPLKHVQVEEYIDQFTVNHLNHFIIKLYPLVDPNNGKQCGSEVLCQRNWIDLTQKHVELYALAATQWHAGMLWRAKKVGKWEEKKKQIKTRLTSCNSNKDDNDANKICLSVRYDY